MRLISACRTAAAALALTLAGYLPVSADVALPSGTCGTAPGTNCLIFDDFTVYSLALLNFQAGAGVPNGNDPFAVDSSPGALHDALVIGTGPSNGTTGTNSDQIGGGRVDDAYFTPNATNGNLTNFATKGSVPNVLNSTEGTQGGSIPNNSGNTWDVGITDLLTYLDGGKLAFFFNLNQTGKEQGTYLQNPQDALGWLAVTIRDDTGAISHTFYLDGDACTGPNPPPPSGNPICGSQQKYDPANPLPGDNNNSNILTDQPAAHNEFAYVHGAICVSDSGPTFGAVLGLGSCNTLTLPPGVTGTDVNQNLGADLAAFALYSDKLWSALTNPNDPNYYCGVTRCTVMSVDFRMAAEDNGYEQLFIAAANIPEPISIMLFAAGLLGIGMLGRRKLKLA